VVGRVPARPAHQHRRAERSNNPITDYHFLYAVGTIVLALTYVGHTWGLGRRWAKLPFVQRHRWLI
jgi:thiosulfate dehydrogenase [quinone] large subunit